MIEFVIPLKREDLLEASEDRYYVADIVAPELLSKKLEESAIQLKKNGGAFILEDFDTLYSSLIHFLELDWQDVHFMYDKIIMKSLTAAHEYSERSLEELMNSDGRKNDERIQALNILKMNIYILSQYFQAYNNKISQKTENVAVVKLKGRKRKTGNEDHIKEHSWDWEEKQKDGLVKLSLLLQLPLINFWDPPVVEETFSNTAAECCYRLLEQQSITLVKSRSIKTTLILILGILIKQYNHGLSFVVKSIQLMKRFDHVSSILAEAVTNYVNHFGCKSLIKHFLEEIVEASGDMLSSTSDQHVGKSFSNFLTDITESNPQDMEPFLEYIFPFLDSELPSLRMLGLSVMTAIFLGCLSSEDISTEAEVKRDKCLELLEDHIQDVNAFVRAKNLQMWQKIVSYGALPKDWLIRLMDSTIGILMDKSSIVTKQAIHLVKIMMESNPFAAKLSLQELLTTLEQEKMAYTELAAQDEANLLQKSMGEEFVWNEVEPELKQFLEDFFKEGGNAELSSSQDSPIVESPMKSTGARFTVINKYITEKNFAKAFKLLVHAEKTMPVLKELRKGIQLGNVEFYVQFFKKIFLEHQSALPLEKTAGTPIKQPPLTPSKRPPTRKLLELNDNATDQDAQAPTVLSAQKARVAFYSNCVEFAKRLSIAVERVTSLMKSKNVFEVVEAVEFIRMAKQFGVSGSEVGAIEMMKLIQCPEESIRTAATRALEVLYLQVEQDANPESAAKQVVKNLSSLVKDMKLSQKALLQILIGEWLKTNSLNEYCVATMLSVFLMEDPTATSEESYLALTLLSCVVTCQPKLVNENMENFFEKGIMRGLKSSQMKDLRVVASVCNILHSATSSHASKRFRNDHKMFTTLTKVIEENFLYFRENNYLLMVESALDLIFKLAMKPGALCHNIIKIVLTKAFGSRNNTSNVANSTGDISSVSINSNNLDSENVDPNVSGVSVLNSDKGYKRIHEEALARLVFILGHFALRLCFYFENDVLDERKKRLRKLQPDENKSGKNQKNDEDDELNMAVDVNAANDDSLAEEIQSLCENKILFGDGLLARNVKLPIHILQNEGKYSSRIVSIASAALGKFMLISRKFCRENIQMFVTILEKTADTSVKVNFIILFGELLPRFPNVIEPWISYVYLRLRDECKDVRLNTLYVLSHLITNELVKIKGQISDVALCIVDEEETIRDAAQRLFQELSTKGNTLYNLLTDIISTLSNPNAEKPLDEENFKKILRFLMDLVQKEKQMEHLVEKLSIRLRESQSERQWSDLAFCLSLLSYSDRSVRKLVDNFVCFKDKLHHPPVYSCLNGIISNANKSSKPGLKEAASELNSVIKEVLDTGSENWVQATPRNANGPNVRPSTTKRAVRGRSCKKKMDFSDSDSDSGAPRTRTKRTTKKTIQYDSSDESEDEPKAKTKRTAKKVIPDSDESEGEPKTKTKRTAKKHVIPDSGGDSEDDIFVPPVASTRKCRKKIVL